VNNIGGRGRNEVRGPYLTVKASSVCVAALDDSVVKVSELANKVDRTLGPVD